MRLSRSDSSDGASSNFNKRGPLIAFNFGTNLSLKALETSSRIFGAQSNPSMYQKGLPSKDLSHRDDREALKRTSSMANPMSSCANDPYISKNLLLAWKSLSAPYCCLPIEPLNSAAFWESKKSAVPRTMTVNMHKRIKKSWPRRFSIVCNPRLHPLSNSDPQSTRLNSNHS